MKNLLIYITLFLTVSGCIERNNPFDPVNYNPDPSSRDTLSLDSLELDSLQNFIDSAHWSLFLSDLNIDTLDSIARSFSLDSNKYSDIISANAITESLNDSTRNENDSVRIHNDSAAPEDFRYMAYTDTLTRYVFEADTSCLSAFSKNLSIRKLESFSFIDSVNRIYYQPPYSGTDTVYTQQFQDSLAGYFDSLSGITDTMLSRMVTLEIRADSLNTNAVIPFNLSAATYNDSAADYNDSLDFIRTVYTHTIIKNNDSLISSVKNASAGDTLVMAPDTFINISLRFDSSGTNEAPIVLLGQPGTATIFQNIDLVISDRNHIIFKNILFANSEMFSVKLENSAGPIVFENCVFRDNSSQGIEVVDSDVRLINCRIVNNGMDGISISSSIDSKNIISIENTLVVHNQRHAVSVLSTNLFISNSTISDNGGSCIHLSNPEKDLIVSNTCLTYSEWGIYFESGYNNNTIFSLGTSLMYGNIQEDIYGFDQPPGYISIDPEYTDRFTDYIYSPSEGSSLDSFENSGILIGYREN